jgi:hypothetical protein
MVSIDPVMVPFRSYRGLAFAQTNRLSLPDNGRKVSTIRVSPSRII